MGYVVEKKGFEDWKAALRASSDKRLVKLKGVALGLSEESFSEMYTLANDKYAAAASKLGIDIPRDDESAIKSCFGVWQVSDAIPRPRSISSRDTRPLAGKVALITGASSGIGKAIALALSDAGASVCIGARREKIVREIANALRTKAPAAGVAVDVTKRDQVKKFVAECQRSLGMPDIVVNCAGVMNYTLMKDAEVDLWTKEVDVNIKGTLNIIGEVLPSMVARSTGHIVNLSSDAGVKAFPGLAVYSGTKFFIEGMSSALRAEVAETGVKVTVIQPGDVKTSISDNQANNEARATYAQSSKEKILA